MRGLRQLQVLPAVLKVLHRSDQSTPAETLAGRIDNAKRDADWIEKESANGFPLLHAHSVIGVWSAVEVLAEDFAVTWLQNMPSAWQVTEVAKLRMPISRFQQLSDAERPGVVIGELSRSFNPEVRRGVGQLKALLGVFNLWPAIGPNPSESSPRAVPSS